MVVTEKRAGELLKALGQLKSRDRRIQVLHIAVGTLFLAGGIALLSAPGFIPFESAFGTPVVNAIVLFCGLILLGAFPFLATRAIQLGHRLNTQSETVKIIEAILEDDPQVHSNFNRDIIMTIYENCLFE